MNRSLLLRALVLLLSLVLAATPTLAAGRQGTRDTRGEQEPGAVAQLVQLLGFLVPALGAAHGTMDPDGQPLSGPSATIDLSPVSPAEDGDAHGTMDPDGSS